MKRESHFTRALNGEPSNLLLFPDDSSAPASACPHPYDPHSPESFCMRHPPLSLAQVTAEWQALVKRLGRRRRVLQTILTGGRPIKLLDHILIIGFPPHRRFHRELLDIADYRTSVEEELSRMFRVRLAVVTALYPESQAHRRSGVFGRTLA